MGLFCVSMHFKTTDDKALTMAVDRRNVHHYRVLPAKDGWTTLYEELASQQDDSRIRQLTGGLSRDLRVAAIAFMVHDSDIACYWLYDNGQLLDHYNSCPDYFDEEDLGPEESQPSGGQPDVLVRYCRPRVQPNNIAAILARKVLFAEDIIRDLAYTIGIDRDRAVGDYRHSADGDFPDEAEDGDSGDDDRGEGPGGGELTSLRGGLAAKLAGMFGLGQRSALVDPQAKALVQAAADENLSEIDRLLAEGTAVDAEAPAALPGSGPVGGLGRIFPGGTPELAMTPILAAVAHQKPRSVERLLAAGADPNKVHPLFGSPLHAAVGAGHAEILRLLIDKGGDVNATNPQRLTPLQIIATGRTTLDRLAKAQEMMKSMGLRAPAIMDQVSQIRLPLEGWDACERLLKEQGAR
jgi:hypothetical protein